MWNAQWKTDNSVTERHPKMHRQHLKHWNYLHSVYSVDKVDKIIDCLYASLTVKNISVTETVKNTINNSYLVDALIEARNLISSKM